MPARQNRPYRVRVDVHVLVNAHNVAYARANAEMAVRKVLANSHGSENDSEANMWAEDWSAFSVEAKSATVYRDGAE